MFRDKESRRLPLRRSLRVGLALATAVGAGGVLLDACSSSAPQTAITAPATPGASSHEGSTVRPTPIASSTGGFEGPFPSRPTTSETPSPAQTSEGQRRSINFNLTFSESATPEPDPLYPGGVIDVFTFSGACPADAAGAHGLIATFPWDYDHGNDFAVVNGLNGGNGQVVVDSINRGLLVPGNSRETTGVQVTSTGANDAKDATLDFQVRKDGFGVDVNLTCGDPASSQPTTPSQLA